MLTLILNLILTTHTHSDTPTVLVRREKKTLYSKKYGVGLCRFAHTQNTVIHTSTKEDSTLGLRGVGSGGTMALTR